jgi:hypothetical protein
VSSRLLIGARPLSLRSTRQITPFILRLAPGGRLVPVAYPPLPPSQSPAAIHVPKAWMYTARRYLVRSPNSPQGGGEHYQYLFIIESSPPRARPQNQRSSRGSKDRKHIGKYPTLSHSTLSSAANPRGIGLPPPGKITIGIDGYGLSEVGFKWCSLFLGLRSPVFQYHESHLEALATQLSNATMSCPHPFVLMKDYPALGGGWSPLRNLLFCII